MRPKIDPEFQAEIAPLTDGELTELRASLVAAGRAIDPLRVWRSVLLDGHHRLIICEELGLPYETVEIDLPSREAALEWIDRHQRGRRNETIDEAVARAVMRGREISGQPRKMAMARDLAEHAPDRLRAVRDRATTLQCAWNAWQRESKPPPARKTAFEVARGAALRLDGPQQVALAQFLLERSSG